MISLPFIVLLAFVGFLSGTAAGLMGIGGGIVLTPICAFLYPALGVDSSILSHTIFGTNLFVASFSSLFTAFRYHGQGLVLWRGALPIAAFSIAGALIGSTAAAFLSSPFLLRVFGILLLFAAFRMLFETSSPQEHGSREPVFSLPALALTGLGTAFVAGLTGVGGGILTIPIMVFFLHYPTRNYPGTSSAIIMFTAPAGMLGYVLNGWNNPFILDNSLGFVYLAAGFPLMVGALGGVYLGTSINPRLSTKRLKQVFGVLLFLVFLKFTFF